jgi:hypothetical protein
MPKLYLLIMLVLFISCEEQITDKYSNYQSQGHDRFGNIRLCVNDPDIQCPAVINEAEEAFAQSCREQGNTVSSCGCHHYVCDAPIYTGIDYLGETRSCTPINQNVMCTMIFTESDQFALDCEKEGGKAITCDCHDHICIKKESLKAETTNKIVSGINQDGISRSCPVQTKLNCETSYNRFQVFAQNCEQEGGVANFCSCEEVLCSTR